MEAMNTGLKLHIGSAPWKIVNDKLLQKWELSNEIIGK